jgi:hypothetical protein
MANPVLAALAQARLRAAPMFARWCELNGAAFCPAAPATVAKFVADCGPLGMTRLWPAVQDISRTHVTLALADPTLGGVAAAAISEVAGVAAPRSWPEDRKRQFSLLPYDIQRFIAEHEGQREKALRRAQNETAMLRRTLAAAQRPTSGNEPTNETPEVKGNEIDVKPSA